MGITYSLRDGAAAQRVGSLFAIRQRDAVVPFSPPVEFGAVADLQRVEGGVQPLPGTFAIPLGRHVHIESVPLDQARHRAILMRDHTSRQWMRPGVVVRVVFEVRGCHGGDAVQYRVQVSLVTPPRSLRASAISVRNGHSSPNRIA